MDSGLMRDEHYSLLVQTIAQLRRPEERREFLEAVCPEQSAIPSELLATVTACEISSSGSDFAHPVLPGQLLAHRFEVVRELGQGGMAVVVEAIDRKLGEHRALKFPKFGHARSIPPEARSALRISHPNICRIHEIHTASTESGPTDFISMEYIDGETLLRRLRREPIAQADAIDLARQLCRGLDAAHSANVLHRDLKSANVMIAPQPDGTQRAVIMDFGLAQPLVANDNVQCLTVSGTPDYVAPERWKGAPASTATDVYALGVVLYEMLTGEAPFAHGTPWSRRLKELPEAPSSSSRAPDRRWDAIVCRCLEPDPARRFSSARQVLEAIDDAFRISHRRKWLVSAAAAMALSISTFMLRDVIWPAPPLARLAVLPFSNSGSDTRVSEAVQGGLYDLTDRLESLGASARRVVVIPLEESLRYKITSPATAAARLGATHTLSGDVAPRGNGYAVKAAITDLRSGEAIRKFSGEFLPSDLSVLSTSLAGIVTSAFRLKNAPAASIVPAAYPAYAAGLASLRQTSDQSEQAIDSFRDALNLDGKSPLILGGLAEAYLRKFNGTGDERWLTEASSAARRAESLNPDSAPVLLVLGSIEQAEGRHEQAIELFHRAGELEPRNSEVWRRTGLAFLRIERHSEAIRALRRAVEIAPDYFAPHLSLGATYFRIGRHTEAATEFRRVTELAPELPVGHSYLGAALLASDRNAEAEQALRRSIELEETRAALNNLGVLLRYLKRDAEAVQVLERALRAGADDAGLRLNLANALRRTGRLVEAREHYRRANELSRAALLRDPRDAASRARLAYSMVQLGSPALAADEALQAARLAPSDYSVIFWAVMTLESLGRRKDALSLLSRASPQQLHDLRKQPDLSDLARDPAFLALIPPQDAARQ